MGGTMRQGSRHGSGVRRLAATGIALVTGALAATGLAVGPAGATVDSCGMSQFPAKVYSMSSLKVACTAATGGNPAITIQIGRAHV